MLTHPVEPQTPKKEEEDEIHDNQQENIDKNLPKSPEIKTDTAVFVETSPIGESYVNTKVFQI